MNSMIASDEASEESEFLPNRMHFACATNGIQQECHISVNSKLSVVSYGPYSQRHIKNHYCCGKSIRLPVILIGSFLSDGIVNNLTDRYFNLF